MSGHETWNTLLYTLHMVSPVPRYSLITESTTRNVHSGYWHANAFPLLMLLLQSSYRAIFANFRQFSPEGVGVWARDMEHAALHASHGFTCA